MEHIYYQGSPGQCDRAFEDFCAVHPKIGIIPRTGGLIPVLPMMDQILWPCRIAGWKKAEALDEIRRLCPPSVPVHRLYDRPDRSNPRVRGWAVILRALILRPEIVAVNGFFEEQEPRLWELFLEALPEKTALVYFGSMDPPPGIEWTVKREGWK